jgi:hypothetical protein
MLAIGDIDFDQLRLDPEEREKEHGAMRMAGEREMVELHGGVPFAAG